MKEAIMCYILNTRSLMQRHMKKEVIHSNISMYTQTLKIQYTKLRIPPRASWDPSDFLVWLMETMFPISEGEIFLSNMRLFTMGRWHQVEASQRETSSEFHWQPHKINLTSNWDHKEYSSSSKHNKDENKSWAHYTIWDVTKPTTRFWPVPSPLPYWNQ